MLYWFPLSLTGSSELLLVELRMKFVPAVGTPEASTYHSWENVSLFSSCFPLLIPELALISEILQLTCASVHDGMFRVCRALFKQQSKDQNADSNLAFAALSHKWRLRLFGGHDVAASLVCCKGILLGMQCSRQTEWEATKNTTAPPPRESENNCM